MVNIWVVSDTHFNHENIIQFCRRPFSNVHQMNQYLVDNWNSVVKPQDKVYHLGDVYMGGGFSHEYTGALLGSLHGHKRLVLGNHDNAKDQLLCRYFEKINMWRMFPEFGLLLSHVPVHESSLYSEKRGYLRNVHGHIHNNSAPPTIHHCNVSVEVTNYTPINIEELRIGTRSSV